MALTRKNPYKIILSDEADLILDNELEAKEAITPGFLIEHVLDTTLKWQKNSAAADQVPMVVADVNTMDNGTVDTDYAIGDLVRAYWLRPGVVFRGVIPSGQNIALGDELQSNGDGKLKEATADTAAANVHKFTALDAPGVVTADTRVTVVVIQ